MLYNLYEFVPMKYFEHVFIKFIKKVMVNAICKTGVKIGLDGVMDFSIPTWYVGRNINKSERGTSFIITSRNPVYIHTNISQKKKTKKIYTRIFNVYTSTYSQFQIINRRW